MPSPVTFVTNGVVTTTTGPIGAVFLNGLNRGANVNATKMNGGAGNLENQKQHATGTPNGPDMQQQLRNVANGSASNVDTVMGSTMGLIIFLGSLAALCNVK